MIKWKGGECPVDKGAKVLVELRSGCGGTRPLTAGGYHWHHCGDGSDIVAYEVLPTAEDTLMIKWEGGECPVDKGAKVRIRLRSGVENGLCLAREWVWGHNGDGGDIVAYEVLPTAEPATTAHLPADAKARKGVPIFSGFVRYFPDAVIAVAELSRIGNDQHNPGKPLHWDRSKSGDELDALTRHLVDAGTLDTDRVRHSTKVAWRALANLQKEIEEDRKKGQA